MWVCSISCFYCRQPSQALSLLWYEISYFQSRPLSKAVLRCGWSPLMWISEGNTEVTGALQTIEGATVVGSQLISHKMAEQKKCEWDLSWPLVGIEGVWDQQGWAVSHLVTTSYWSRCLQILLKIWFSTENLNSFLRDNKDWWWGGLMGLSCWPCTLDFVRFQLIMAFVIW